MPAGSRFCPACGADTQDPASSPRITLGNTTDLQTRLQAAVKGHYEVKELLGRGGMGAVFLATDLSLGRPVAIKVLPPDLSDDKKFYQRFEHEARTAAKLDHPHIIPIYAVETRDDLNYFVMKYVTGRTLDQLLQSGPLPIDVAQRILWEAACAFGHAHSRGVVHRDVKPANIMIDDHGLAMVTDFGISKALESANQFTTTGQVIGTPHYMSPEQAKGMPVDGRSDQYSLGIMGYRMLAGRLPFMDDSVHTVIYKHIFEMPPPLEMLRPDAPAFLRTAIHRAIQKDADDRFPTMEEFATAAWPEHPVRGYSLSGGAMFRTSLDAATEITSPQPKRARGTRVAAVVGAVVAMAVGGVAGATLLLGRDGLPLPGRGADGGAETQTTFLTASDSQTQAAPILPTDSGAAVQADSQPADSQPPEPVPAQLPEQRQEPASPAPQRRDPPVQRAPERQPERPRLGYLTVGVIEDGQGSFATVYVDGREIGDTPIFKLELPIGRHVVVIQREGYRTITDTVEVNPGSTTNLKKPLIREQP
jgi:serine/threonine protein kinase